MPVFTLKTDEGIFLPDHNVLVKVIGVGKTTAKIKLDAPDKPYFRLVRNDGTFRGVDRAKS